MKFKFKLNTRSNIRKKLILSLLSVVIITGVSSIIVGISIIKKSVIQQAYDILQSDINTANYIYNSRVRTIDTYVKHTSSLIYIRNAILTNDRKRIQNKISEIFKDIDIDTVNITDPAGRVIFRYGLPEKYGDNLSRDNFVSYVMKNRKSCSGTDVIDKEILIHEGPDLAETALIKVKSTLMAEKETRQYEDRAMAIKAASPIVFNGKLIGIIYAQKLLNRNNEFVDHIKQLIFKDEKIDGFDLGSATIFLEGLRIATNVKEVDGQRAIGTSVSQEVYNKVFRQGKLWLDKAFVVNNWYLSAYSPLYDIYGNLAGILYVGTLEKKYSKIMRNGIISILMVIFLAVIVAVALSIYLINIIIKPVNKLVEASMEIAKGKYSKIDIHSEDEMGYLCSVFNTMIDAIQERDRQLMERTEKQIVQSEKLASLGRLASGIAHEINNPLTGVLTYSSLLLEDLKDTEYSDDLKVIVNETMRCRDTVKGILEFARETRLERVNANLNDVLNNSISILKKLVNFKDIVIRLDLAKDLPEILVDINQMKSVFNNLAVNAADAMPGGGELYIMSYYNRYDKTIIIEFADTGTGISKENLSRIYDPFFTTKDVGKGTGLGLAVTYGIVKKHNGIINFDSKPGEGTRITLKFPVD